MAYLLDTHVLIWAFSQPEALSSAAHAVLRDPATPKFFSMASLWELTIKYRLGKLDLLLGLPEFFEQVQNAANLVELPVRTQHLQALAVLPLHHNDPFDRLLLAQALTEDLVFLTKDSIARSYPVRTLW